MKDLLKKYLFNTLAIFTLTQIIDSFKINGGWQGIFYASFILSLLLLFVKPVFNFLLFPLNLLTFNMAKWILNFIVIYLWIIITPQISIAQWQFPGATFGFLAFSSYNFGYFQVIIIITVLLILLLRFYEWLDD